jgi:flavodoxin
MILVVYYSRAGKTKRVTEDIAKRLNADIERIIDTTDRSGFFGLVSIVRDSLMKKPFQIEVPKNNPAEYDLVILGTPVWGGTAALPVKTYLEKYNGKLPEMAYVFTSGGSKEEQIVPALETLVGVKGKAALRLTFQELRTSKKDEYEKKLAAFIAAVT